MKYADLEVIFCGCGVSGRRCAVCDRALQQGSKVARSGLSFICWPCVSVAVNDTLVVVMAENKEVVR